MITRKPIIEKLISPDWLKLFEQHAVVGWFAEVEAAHWKIHRLVENMESATANDPDDENHVDPQAVAERQRYADWMEQVKPLLPDWYKSGVRMEVERQVSELFTTVSIELNKTIQTRRQVDKAFNSGTPLGQYQEALEKCRVWVMRLAVMPLIWGQKAP